MTSVAAFLAYLFLLPVHVRLVVTNRALLEQVFRVLLDPETGALRMREREACIAVDRALQIVEAGLARAVWLFARQLARLPCARPASPLRTFAPHGVPTPAALLQRALALQAQLDTFHARACRIVHELGWRERYSPLANTPARNAGELTSGNTTQANLSRIARATFAAPEKFALRAHPGGAIRLRGPPAAPPIP